MPGNLAMGLPTSTTSGRHAGVDVVNGGAFKLSDPSPDDIPRHGFTTLSARGASVSIANAKPIDAETS